MPLATSLDSLQDNPIGSLSGIFGAPQPDSEAQAHADAEPLTLVDDATYNSGAACSSTATFTAVYSMNGAQGAKPFLTA